MPDVQMDYDGMEEMANLFRQGSEQLEETMRVVENLAAMLEGGALLGRGGELLSGALRERLNPRIGRLREKFDELTMDVYGALVDLRDGDHEAASRFKG